MSIHVHYMHSNLRLSTYYTKEMWMMSVQKYSGDMWE